MGFLSAIVLLCSGLLVSMLVLLELGRRLGKRREQRDPGGTRAGGVAAEGAVFALLGLLIAFSFSGAASRFDDRRLQITDEANAIGTAWLRLDLLPREAQPRVRASFVRYFDARLEVYRWMHDRGAVFERLAQVQQCQNELWKTIVEIEGQHEQGWGLLLLPAVNEMFDIAGQRTQAMWRHPPYVVFVLLFVLALACALLAGFEMAEAARRPTVHMFAFSAAIAITIFVVLDLEHPRQGFLTLESSDQVMLELRAGMR